jgi:Family of unknown function (DUF6334)
MGALTKEIVDSDGALREVRARVEPGVGVVSLALQFENGAVLVSAAGDDDTIAVGAVAAADGQDISQEMPWRAAIGRGLLWWWSLTNQHGFEDGCQLEFGRAGQPPPEHLCVQLMVAASQLSVSTVGDSL